jgi:hypothetical protein
MHEIAHTWLRNPKSNQNVQVRNSIVMQWENTNFLAKIITERKDHSLPLQALKYRHPSLFQASNSKTKLIILTSVTMEMVICYTT